MRTTSQVVAVLLVVLALLSSVHSVAAQPSGSRPSQPPGRPTLIPPIDIGSPALLSCGYGCARHTDGNGNQYYYSDFAASGAEFTVRAAAAGTLYQLPGIVGYGVNGEPLGEAITVAIDHGNGWVTSYAHLKPGSLVKPNGSPLGSTDRVWVNAGDKIAIAGSSGATSVHLHFGLTILINGTSWSYPTDEIFDYAAEPVGRRRADNGLEIQFNAFTPRIGQVNFTRLRLEGSNHEGKRALWDWNQFPSTTWSHTITNWWWKGAVTLTFDTVSYGQRSCTVNVPAQGRTPAIITYLGNGQCAIRS